MMNQPEPQPDGPAPRYQKIVNELAVLLNVQMEKEGGINPLEMKVNVLVMMEMIQVLIALVVAQFDGEHDENTVLDLVCDRLVTVTQTLKDEILKPRLVMPPGGAGTKGNRI